MTKPQGITPEIREWISEEIIGEEEEQIHDSNVLREVVLNHWKDARNELRREQERRLRD